MDKVISAVQFRDFIMVFMESGVVWQLRYNGDLYEWTWHRMADVPRLH